MTTSHPAKRRRTLPPSALHKPFRSPLRRASPQASGRIPAETPQTGKTPLRRISDGSHDYSQTIHSSVSSSTALSSSIQPTQSTAPTLSPSPPRGETSRTEHSHKDTDPSKLFLSTADHDTTQDEIPDSAPTSVAGASPIRLTPSPPPSDQASTYADRAAIHRLEEDIALLRTHPSVRAGVDRLPALIASWTRAARNAAEALQPDFEAGRERCAGGGGAWEDEDWAAGVAERIAALEAGLEGMGTAERGVVGGEIEGLKGMLVVGRERGEELERDGGEEGEETVGGMGAMLRVMGVEWDLLGWDEQEQGWRS